MLTLFYSPHMTSIDNEAGRASGHADVPLSVSGHKLAQELGHSYATETLDAIFLEERPNSWLRSTTIINCEPSTVIVTFFMGISFPV
jgi:histidine phosphatase superfamily protein (branch 1)